MEPGKEQWINDVLGSINGLNRTEPSPFLWAKIRNKLTNSPSAAHVPGRMVWLVAAGFAVLAMLNWQLIRTQSATTDPAGSELSTVITEMHLYPATHQLYDVWTGPTY